MKKMLEIRFLGVFLVLALLITGNLHVAMADGGTSSGGSTTQGSSPPVR